MNSPHAHSDLKKRTARANRAVLFLWSTVGMFVLLVLLLIPSLTFSGQNEITIFAASSLNAPLTEAAIEFEKTTGTRVIIQSGGSNTLLVQLRFARSVDLFIPADDIYADEAQKQGFIKHSVPLARQNAVLISRRKDNLQIESLAQLLQSNLKLVQARPESAAIGQVTQTELQQLGLWEALENKTLSMKLNVSEVLNDVRLGAADVGIVWDSVAVNQAEIRIHRLPELATISAEVKVGLCTHAANQAAANEFVKFLKDPNGGQRFLKDYGFQVNHAPQLSARSMQGVK
ncbi:MAG: molybdate ABC transporter substrate-binding protein [Blastopirellula sp.]|nr:MAG: molybdate ABC transporter substrate-binding protein [Blastopirellula sp.]